MLEKIAGKIRESFGGGAFWKNSGNTLKNRKSFGTVSKRIENVLELNMIGLIKVKIKTFLANSNTIHKCIQFNLL